MSKISVSALLADFQTMLRERWKYVWGSAKRGEADCAGAFAWAYRQHGHSIYHGSNRIAREEIERLCPVGSVRVVPGMAAFKRRIPGDKGYSLPSSYQPGGSHFNGDLNDYYHIGLVDEDTARVLNAQSASTGFVASPISQNWSHVGYLRQVDYGADAQMDIPEAEPAGQAEMTSSRTAVTVASSGGTVNLRAAAQLSAKLVDRIPLGETVTLRGPELSGWYPVRWGKKEGYVMADYLRANDPGAVPATPSDGTSYAVTFDDLTRAQAERLMADHSEYRSTMEERHG